MSATARRRILITYSGDVDGEQQIDAVDNATSPASVQVVELDGDTGEEPDEVWTSVAIPSGATAVTILKPADNTSDIYLCPDENASGLRVHGTEPDSVSIHEDDETLWFSVVGTAVTVRLFWS